MPSTAHFFTDPTKLSTQLTSYGPVSGNENTEYMITSKLQFSSEADAIAVCTGYVFLQPHATDNSLVNLVLLPILADQIENNYTAVKYFVYRGLKKSNILTGSDEFLAESHPDASDLVNSIWQQYNMLKTLVSTIDSTAPNIAAIGWDTSSNPGTDSLNALHNADNDDIQLAAIQAGQTLAKFDMLNAGFEVMLEENFFEPDLAYVRAADFKITTTIPQSGDIPGNEPIAKMRQREIILNFMDPAAWYMTFFKAGVNIPGDAEPVKGFDALYTTLLSTFITRNTLYLDIRNENSYSLNYYKDNEGQTGDSDYGEHIQVSWDGTTFAPANYYKDYWPILTLSPPANATSNYNELHLKFRKLYNPEPLIFGDYTFKLVADNDNSPTIQLSEPQFLFEFPLGIIENDWTQEFSFVTPNMSSAVSGQNSIAFYLKLFNVRTKLPEISIPSTGFPKETPIDNIFGPITDFPLHWPSDETNWEVYPKKRFYVGPNSILVGESGVERSNNAITFYFRVLNEYYRFDPFLSQDYKNQITTSFMPPSGRSQNSNAEVLISDYLDNGLTYATDFELRKDNVIVNTIPIPIRYFSNEKLRNNNLNYVELSISVSEFEDQIVPALATLDTSVQEPMFTIDAFNQKTDDNGKTYFDGIISIVGLDSNGIYQRNQPSNGNIYIFTRDNYSFSSIAINSNIELPSGHDPNAYFNFSDFIGYAQTAEDVFSIAPFNDSPVSFVTRIRVMYYSGFKFNPIVPDLEYEDNSPEFETKELHKSVMQSPSELLVSYVHLVSKADENLDGDNPSPYLLDLPNAREIDLGHVLFGLQALQFPLENSPSPSLIGRFFLKYNLRGIHYAGWVADIGIAVGTNERHIFDNEVPVAVRHYGNIYYPENPDIDRYFEISAPEPDLEGDIDAYGLKAAWEDVESINPEFKFSDVLKYYFQNPDPENNLNHYGNRYFIFCLQNGIVTQISGNTYSWPNYTNLPVSLLEPVEWMATFWFDQYNELLLIFKNPPVNYHFQDCKYVLIKFLQWLKPRLENEQPNKSFL
ncbi:hypothetical protein G3O08_18055 [Cryomorpha ignava]|uniref:Uncharacterized protein n=1 Tax=Cryomorpha ignava TaxID=101383 RepID=A0A7K3WV86_9FLAO|nr:hypothetical protein [Cryomorpha ignava]NEN25404.1 hypothetical protein [Cryomorpha ignava]